MRGDRQELENLLPNQVKTIRGFCAFSEARKRLADPREKATAKPDGDEIAVYLDWLIGDLAESISATCQSLDAGANWSCSSDGDFGDLKRATESDDAPDYLLLVNFTHRVGGQESNWKYSLSIDTPDPATNETVANSEGSVPENTCDPNRYPNDSVLAYILQNYSTHCQ